MTWFPPARVPSAGAIGRGLRDRARSEDPVRRTGLALWLLLALVVLLNAHGVLVVDIKPEVYLAPWQSFRAYLSPWEADPQLGFPSFNVGLAPVAGVVGVLQALGASPALSMKILRLGLLTAAAFGAARLFRHLAPGRASRYGGLVAAVVYVANPYTVVAGAALGVLWPYAVLPWLTWSVVRAVEHGRGWRWPATAALCFVATTGMNAGVIAVMQLVAMPVFVALARSRSGRTWRQVAVVLCQCLLLAAVLSAYWIVPTLGALGAGTVVVNNSETNTGIATTSSLAEVLRGLGLWPIYGADADGAWVPEHAGYVVSLLQLVLSYLFTGVLGAAAVFARGRLRVAALAGVVVSAVVMVGLYPAHDSTAFGHVLSWAFAHVPGLGALRTTNKSGAAFVLCAAVLVAAASVNWLRRESDPWRRHVAAGALFAALALSAVPAFNGNLYTSPLQVPGYWRSAAATLDEGAPRQRVWFVPGEVDAAYRWTPNRPDDLSNSLLSRPAVVRTVIPVTSAVAANYLAAADTQLQEGTLPTAGLSTYARYLGVGDLLLRNDMAWERVAGARPGDLQPEVNGDPGLRPAGNFGEPGENVMSSDGPPAPEPEASLPPLQRYTIADPLDPLHASPLAGTVLLVGDGYAVSAAQDAGLLPAGAGFRYLADLSTNDLSGLLGPAHRVVLTDTNRRRTTVAGRLVGGQGPLLAEHEDPGPTRSLWSPANQTVLTTEGGTARATQVGSVFGTIPDAVPENAFDHDLTTAWEFGDFRTGVGQRLTLTTPQPVAVGRVSIQSAELGSVRIDRVRVAAGGHSRTVSLDGHGRGVADLSGIRAKRVTLTVDRLRGDGFNRVGLAEVDVAGVSITRVARTPLTLQRAVTAMSPEARSAFARTPLDVVLTRVRAARAAVPEEEPMLVRDLALPDERTFRTYGVIRPTASLPEDVFDTLAGADGSVRARSSSRAFDLPTVRASNAVDGRAETSWVPGGRVVGQTLTVEATPRPVDHVSVTQPTGTRDLATRAQVSLDGIVVAEGQLRAGTTRISFSRQQAGTLVLKLTGRSGAGAVRIEEVDFSGARVVAGVTPASERCATVGTIDGRPLRVRPVVPITSLDPVLVAGCAEADLGPGTHRLRPQPGWTVDRLVLRDLIGSRVTAPPESPQVRVTASRSTSYDVSVAASTGPYTLVLGQAYDARWRASMDGHDLGPAKVVDGYSSGWVVSDPGRHDIRIRYGPQLPSDAALGLSLAGGLLCALLLYLGRNTAPLPRGTAMPSQLWGAVARRDTRGAWVVVGGGALLAGLVFGWWCAVLCLGLAAWHRWRPPPAEWLLVGGLACWGAIPVAWVAGNAHRWGTVTPDLVALNPWPHRFAVVGLVLLVVGVARQERARPSGTLAADD